MKDLDLRKILKDAPRGTKLYSPLFGECSLYDVNSRIELLDSKNNKVWLYYNGKYNQTYDGECMLFPSKDNRDWSKFEVGLPKTWYEFCGQNPDINNEYYIDDESRIKVISSSNRKAYRKNLLSSKSDAEAHLALMQLHRLRDVYRRGWVPDWSDTDTAKYCIYYSDGKLGVDSFYISKHFLAFKDKPTAEEFLNRFEYFISIASEFIT